jgi:hypothetical protein
MCTLLPFGLLSCCPSSLLKLSDTIMHEQIHNVKIYVQCHWETIEMMVSPV